MDSSNRPSKHLRPLLIAEAANPEWTSVPLVGWNIARAIAKETKAHLVTHVRNREAILRAGLQEGADFTAIDNERIAAPMYKLSDRLRGGDGKGWTTITAFGSLTYYTFEWELWRHFGPRIKAGEFDLVHRITPLSPTSQSPIAKKLARAGVPFVIGPLNGGVPWPKNFLGRQHAEKEWLSHIRGIYRMMPAYSATRKYASAILTGSKHTRDEIPAWAKSKCTLIPENGIDEERIASPRNATGSPLQAIFVGRLVPYKGADMLLKAAAPFLKSGQLVLHIVGDGPERSALEALVDELRVRSGVQIHGWLPQPEVLDRLRAADVFAFPSVREFGGGVVVEAMAQGAVPVVADYAGPSELVDDSTGIRVPFTDAESLIAGMRGALAKLIASPELLPPMSRAAIDKVRRELTWQAKARQILQVYGRVLEEHTAGKFPKPENPG
jgi:glycosyltransferase involved in cell wall biosynthesis